MAARPVPSRGAGQAIGTLHAGDTDLMVTGLIEAVPHLRDNRPRAVAVTAPERLALLPEVPAAAGTVPGYAMRIWHAMLGPRDTPREAVARLAEAMAPLRGAGTPLSRRLSENGATLRLDGPEPLALRLAGEVPLRRDLVARTGIRAE